MFHTLLLLLFHSSLFFRGQKILHVFKSVFLFILFLPLSSHALTPDELKWGTGTNNTTVTTPMELLTLIENVLLWGILPVVVVGVSLYVAYQLFTAEGDAAKLKSAWKTLLYSAGGIIIALLSYALVKIASTYSIF